jgi:hypothetical protein
MREKYKAEELITLGEGLPDLKLENSQLVNMSASSIAFNTTAIFENPLVTQMNLTYIQVSLGVEGVRMLDVRLEHQSGSWELAYQKWIIFKQEVMEVPMKITLSLHDPASSFAESFSRLTTTLGKKPALMGPFDIIPTTGGKLFGLVSSKMELLFTQDIFVKALDLFITQTLTGLLTQGTPNNETKKTGLLDLLLDPKNIRIFLGRTSTSSASADPTTV